jgi:hypothetical protein
MVLAWQLMVGQSFRSLAGNCEVRLLNAAIASIARKYPVPLQWGIHIRSNW